MDVDDRFVSITGLICEPTRARMLWSLLDGRAYTATELSASANTSATSASNHLAKLLEADLVKVEVQGRHRYYSFSGPEVAYAIESLANLAGGPWPAKKQAVSASSGLRFCRTCYDHLAGHVSVRIVDALLQRQCIDRTDTAFLVTENGWEWFEKLAIYQEDFSPSRRPLARPCLDWSERRPHLAGQLGAVLLDRMMARQWFRKVQFSRELVLTHAGQQGLSDVLNLNL
ncbi:ArsR/SmtB family transcription factor [Fibrella sp. WM1]|uniref:ArsR/SmtB family transcription factor n=1 Tax=Fibrella musci TaxID=3242485 RepID=UPI0035222D32